MNLTLPRKLRPMLAASLLGVLILPLTAQAQLTIPGNNGQDDAFEPTANVQVDLSQAVTGDWETTADSEGKGVYDPEQWAVIFRYTTVTIPSNVTVTFKNHPSRAPVIWLVQGNVTIAGTVSLNGAGGHDRTSAATLAEPGPGGFRGGRGYRVGVPGSAGMGPGGGGYAGNLNGNDYGAGGSYGTFGGAGSAARGDLYGNEGVFPLIGGAGGGGSSWYGEGGGGGGGAIFIASDSTVTLNGLIRANGGSPNYGDHGGGGSGGAIRLVANVVQGSGALSAVGGGSYASGGAGRIRVEANTITLTAAHVNSTGTPQTPPRIFREASDGVPTIKAMTLNGEAVPDDPASYPTQDVALLDVDGDPTVPLVVTAEHVPEGSTVNARVVRLSGVEEIIPATYNGTSGNDTNWTADIPVVGGFSTIQVHAVLP